MCLHLGFEPRTSLYALLFIKFIDLINYFVDDDDDHELYNEETEPKSNNNANIQ